MGENMLGIFGNNKNNTKDELTKEDIINALKLELSNLKVDYDNLQEQNSLKEKQISEVQKKYEVANNNSTHLREQYCVIQNLYQVLQTENEIVRKNNDELNQKNNDLENRINTLDPVLVRTDLEKSSDKFFSKTYNEAALSARDLGKKLALDSSEDKHYHYHDISTWYLNKLADKLDLESKSSFVSIGLNDNATKERKSDQISNLKPTHFLSDISDGVIDYWQNVKDEHDLAFYDKDFDQNSFVLLAKSNNDGKVLLRGYSLNFEGDEGNLYLEKSQNLIKDLFVNYMLGFVEGELSKEKEVNFAAVKKISDKIISIDENYKPLVAEIYSNAKSKNEKIFAYIPNKL